jgi:hypothetical protein
VLISIIVKELMKTLIMSSKESAGLRGPSYVNQEGAQE